MGELAFFGRVFGVPRKHSLVQIPVPLSTTKTSPEITNVGANGQVDWIPRRQTGHRVAHADSTFEDELPLL